ncbi:hypothetical protein J2Z40_000277 [Cytobacillus eiseniae]|uniref:Uncharacterized protein n=1 Tax=Cytobacillus eiseniae TaxID=762947 RepID=A0ABS4RA06_9BACI|nr:hypothetical protein [Cytobacillus eiseniae]MBP2239724.1 hypothetical protein [Cytobacillus eiseniae]
MNLHDKLKIIKYVGGALLTCGLIIFLFGFFGSGVNLLTPIGIGTVMGAVFIFIMGIFFFATEELLNKDAEHLNQHSN